MMSFIKSKGLPWLLIMSIIIMTVPMLIQAEESTSATNIEQLKQLRQIQNQSVMLKNLKANSVSVKATPEQERMLRLSNALTKVKQQALPNLDASPRINLKRTDRSVPEPQVSVLRDVLYGSGSMSFHPDSLYFNFLTGENSGDSLDMDVRITGNELLNFGNEFANYGDPSMLYWLSPDSTLDGITYVDAIDDPMRLWTDISWDWSGGNSGLPLAVGNIWVVYARTSDMYVVLEVTAAVQDLSNPAFSFDYMIQTDGSNIFDGTPSLFDMTVNDEYADTLVIGSNPYFEIFLDGAVSGEFGVFWDANHNGDLDEDDVPLDFYDFMDNDMHDEDPAPGIFGFTYSDEMADGLNYLADDLIFAAFTDMDMAVNSVHFYTMPSPFSVSGSIYETNGGGPPLAGIVVWAFYEDSEGDGPPSVIVVTDGAGQYHIDLPDTGNVIIGTSDHFFMTEGLMPDPTYHFVNVQGSEFGYNFFYISPTSGIEGFVYDETGAPIEGVEVHAKSDDGSAEAYGYTSAAGYYYIGVMPGVYRVGISWDMLPDDYIIPHGEFVDVGDFAVESVNFTLHTADNFISGVVTLDGVYLEGATVVAMNELGFSFTVSEVNGYFDIPVFGGPDTFYDIMVWMPDMADIIQVSDNHMVPAGAEGVEILLETVSGGIFGYFIDVETGEPIIDGYDLGMMARNIDTGSEFYSGPDYDGYYELYVPPGLYEVMAGGMEWMGPEPDTLLIDEFLVPHDFYLTHLSFDASLEGYVFDQAGMPIPFAQIQIGNEGWGSGTMADEFGYYYFDLPVGYYYVRAWAEGYNVYFDEFPVGPGYNSYNFFLESFQVDGAIAGLVHDDLGVPIIDADVYAYGWEDDQGYWTYTDEFGEFWFDLPNGTYDVVAGHEDYPPMWIDEIPVMNDTTYLDFTLLLPDGGVDGYVYDDMGYGIYNAEVVIVSMADSVTGFWGYTDDNGYFSIPAPNGEYAVFARAEGYDETHYGQIIINDDWITIDIYLEEREFATPPEINFIIDQPNDQGRWVRMQFWPGGTEWGPFHGYSIWRLTNTPFGPIVDFVEYLPNHDDEMYNLVLPTLVDSSAYVSDPLDYMSAFLVTGHFDMYGYIDGDPAAGYSVDNIQPGIPGPLTLLSSTEDGVEIGWEMSMADDFQYFEVYRATNPGFTDAEVYATVETMYSDSDVTIGQTYYYMVSAVDANGNLSEGTNVVTTSIVSVDALEMIPTAFGLSQNYPNPFNPTTSIEFALPEASEISLEIYNILGQKVRTLVNGYVPAGYINTSWDGLDQNGKEISSGTYIYRLQTADQTFSKKMVLMK